MIAESLIIVCAGRERLQVGRGHGLSLWQMWEGCRYGARGESMGCLLGLPPSARGEIACGKLRSGAVSNTVPFRKGSASSQHHRDAACDAIELGKSIDPKVKRTRPPPDARAKRVDEVAACRRGLVLYLHN